MSCGWVFLLFIALFHVRPIYCSVIFFYDTKGIIEKGRQFSFEDKRSVASQYKETKQTELGREKNLHEMLNLFAQVSDNDELLAK